MTNIVMRHAFWTVALLAFVYAIVALFDQRYTQFAVVMALFGVALGIDLRVHRRGPYRDRSAVLLLIAFVAIVVTGVFAQVGVTA
ncbi:MULTISPECIES: hypothetical protein [Mycobacteroides]|uniref:hypothetical protein n=1 Tax=Mycobacteroides TaxID=670516 RepID=UPI0002F800EB|nr:hypothetical protein [Mycobacteroides chelonae]GLE58961.1 hypothetical protein NJBCHELONAE_42710 [Mycobacteroides chelonae]